MSNSEPKEAIIYCRTPNPHSGTAHNGIEAQDMRCRAHVARQGYTVLEAIHEVAAGCGSTRKGMRRMSAVVEARAKADLQTIIVADSVSRLTIDPQTLQGLRQGFRTWRATLELVDTFRRDPVADEKLLGKLPETVRAQLERGLA